MAITACNRDAHTAAEDETTADEEVEASQQVRVLPRQAPAWEPPPLAERRLMGEANWKEEDEAGWWMVPGMKGLKKKEATITKLGMLEKMNWKEVEEGWTLAPLEQDAMGHTMQAMGCCCCCPQHGAVPDMLATASAAIPMCIMIYGDVALVSKRTRKKEEWDMRGGAFGSPQTYIRSLFLVVFFLQLQQLHCQSTHVFLSDGPVQ